MTLFGYFIWNADPTFFILPGLDREVRWYGVLFAVGFFISQQIMFYMYRKEGKPEKDVDTLTIFMIISTILGARLGHVLFYEPDKYLSNPIDILKVWEGGLASHGAAFAILFALWLYTRYDIRVKVFWIIKDFIGLPYGFKSKRITRPGQNWYQVVDRIVIVVALTGCLIRFGNFMNSEIYGKPTKTEYGAVFTRNFETLFTGPSSALSDVEFEKGDGNITENGLVSIKIKVTFKNDAGNPDENYAKRFVENTIYPELRKNRYITEHLMYPSSEAPEYTVFTRTDGSLHAELKAYGIPRHPTQLYESGTSLLLFFILFLIWNHFKRQTPPGLLLGIFLIYLFGLRFVHELFKENQVAFEDDLMFNMGQVLSIPLILGGVFILLQAIKKGRYIDQKD